MNVSVARKAGTPDGSPSRRHLPMWAPLRNSLYRSLWIASLASNIGTWMHDVGAAWLMTSLTTDPQLNALVAAAGAFPVFLLALPAGALADIVDRRKLIVGTMCWMFLCASTLATLTLLHLTTPVLLLLLTLMMAMGSAMTMPAWQAIVPEVVKKRQFPAAMSLNGISFNLSRVIGPAIGGLVIQQTVYWLGNQGAPGVVFALNAISYLGVLTVMWRWQRAPRQSDLPPEHVVSAMRTGLRYTRHSPEVRGVLVRLAGFNICASALWAMLPLYSRQVLKLDASGYGSLMGFFGASAVLMGLSYSGLRRRFPSNEITRFAVGGVAVSLVILALLPQYTEGLAAAMWARGAMFLAGFCWVGNMLTTNVVLMRSVPDWVRSRAASMFLFVFMGTSTVGSVMWGAVARAWDIQTALLLSACGLTIGLVALRSFRIVDPQGVSLEPSTHWPEAPVTASTEAEDGPVLVTVEYQINEEDNRAFLEAMEAVRRMRLRDGALRWNVFQDVGTPSRWMETMLVESWNEYLRQYGRVTHADRQIEAAAHAFHRGPEPPQVSHLIAGHGRRLAEDTDDEMQVSSEISR